MNIMQSIFVSADTAANVVLDARETLEDAIDILQEPGKGSSAKPRDYRHRANKKAKSAIISMIRSGKKMKSPVQEQLHFICRDLKIIENYAPIFDLLTDKQLDNIITSCKIYRNQELIDNQKLPEKEQKPVTDRIVNFHQPWGNSMRQSRSQCGVWRENAISDMVLFVFAAVYPSYHDGSNLIQVIEQYRELHYRYPAKVCVDQIYHTKENREFCAEHNIIMTGAPLGSRKKLEGQEAADAYRDSCERNQVEGKFGVGITVIF